MKEKCGIGGINNMKNIVNRCGYCGKTFGNIDNLRVHQFCCYEGLKYEGLKPEDYFICQYCGDKFNEAKRFLEHENFCSKRKIEILNDKDNIKPTHYNKGKKDLIEMWYQTMTLEQFRGSMKSNIIKYTMRYENKNGLEDIEKAIEYLTRLKGYEENEIKN